MTINAGEFGLTLNLNVNYDMSAYTSLTLNFTRPDGTKFSATPTLGLVDTVQPAPAGTFLAKQYVTYLFKSGDLPVAGTYLVRLTYTDPGPKQLISDQTSFTVAA